VSDKDFVVKNGLVVGTTATINGVIIDPSGATENQILKFDGTKFAAATNTGGGGVGSTYAGTIGNGTDTEFTVTHNLSTRDVVVVARNALTPYEQIDVRWEATSVNTVKFDFSSPPASNSVRVAVYAAVAGNTLATTTVSTSAPENPTEGDLWFDSNSAGMFVYYDSQWIEIGGSSSGARLFVGTTPPTNTAEGILWFNSNTAQVFVKYDSQWIEVGAFASSIDVSNAQTNDTLRFDGTKFVASAEGIFNDNILLINNSSDAAPVNNAGIEVERGNSNNVLIRWNESTDVWEFTNNGSTYQELGRSTATVSTTAPSSPNQGQIWFDSSEGGTYVYYGSTWIEVGAAPLDAVLEKVDAKGDLLAGDAADSLARLAVGTNGQFLTANSSTATGLQWVTPSYAAIASPTFTGTVNVSDLTSSTTITTLNLTATGSVSLPANTSIGNISNTEISYLDGVTSSIQTQINTKASTGKAIAMAIVFGG
jgi:hypothetical protein